ncbi:MAG: DUF559 domain-containing protein, partial [Actinomycetes bacterium]
MSARDLALINDIALRQQGNFTLAQADEVGVSLRVIRGAVSDGLLRCPQPKVRRFAADPLSELAAIWAAHLQVGPRSSVSHESALMLHGVERVPFALAVTVPAGVTHVHRDIRVHRLNDLVDEHRTTVDGLPTTTVERAVVDVASVFSRKRLEFVVDQLTITTRVTTVGRIARAYRQVNRRGRTNIATLAQVLDSRSTHGPAPRSGVERRFDELIRASGLPAPVHEFPLPGVGAINGLVDRCWPEVKLIVEIDGRSWHAREEAMARDRARDRAAAAAGYLVLR